MKVAVVHDWFNNVGGGEKVVKEIIHCFPDADIYCLFDFFDSRQREKFIYGKKTTTSFIQYFPFAKKFYRLLFPLFPTAIESFDLSAYDLIISSSYCVAKGVKKHNNQLHICYCHSPVRYAWDLRDDYVNAVRGYLKKKIFIYFLNRLKKWDKETTDRVDYFIANSQNVGTRIKENYERDSIVIYPPVDIDSFSEKTVKSNYYMTVSRLVAYKRIELLVKAFESLPHLQFEIAGEGPSKKGIQKMAPPNVKVLGFIDSQTKRQKIENAKAFVAAANEDFGITIVEAQASGTPVIVPYVGGYKETVNDATGVFYKEQTVESVIDAITNFETQKRQYNTDDFAKNVSRFGVPRFHDQLKTFVNEKYDYFYKNEHK